jgi:hypothetical protein
VGVLWALERAIVARAPAMVIGVVITGRPLPPKLLLLAAVRVWVHRGASEIAPPPAAFAAALIAATSPAAPPPGPEQGTLTLVVAPVGSSGVAAR